VNKLEIGIDCVNILHFNDDILSKKNFLRKIFTENEIKYCEKKVKASQHYAVRFAGKEAVVKALSCYGITVSLKQIEILNKKNRCPYVKIIDKKLSDLDIKISLSHSKETAMAVAIINKN
jgi:holo-[acyl-carrier protein] synthase